MPLLHQVDEAEVPRTENDRVLIAQLTGAALRTALAPGLAERLADGGIVLVACAHPGHAPVRERALHEVVEAVAVALLERRALRLAVVRQHDELVGTRGEPTSAVDPAELLIELAQRLERVGALEP